MHSILVANAKGGCGKSTLTMNLASYYAAWGIPVTIAECDPHGLTHHWLRKRPKSLHRIRAVEVWREGFRIPDDTEYCLIDAPAGVQGTQLADLLEKAQSVLIPILPSPLDIRAGGYFVYELLRDHAALMKSRRMAVVANRVRRNTLVYRSLQSFLGQLNVPFTATLRDTQNYVRSVENGLGVFDLPPRMAAKDIADWKPLLNWLVQGERGADKD